jgi:hypothetical protein
LGFTNQSFEGAPSASQRIALAGAHRSPAVSVPPMEAFESFVGLALEGEGFVVSPAIKFDVRLPTRKAAYPETQTHGYEVDLVAARADRVVLATVKSFFGSRGVVAEHVTGRTTNERGRKLYLLLNDEEIRKAVVTSAARRYGYRRNQVELRLYVGRFAGPTKGQHEIEIRKWAAGQRVGRGSIKVLGADEVVDKVRKAAARKQYRDNPVLVTMKVLEAAGLLTAEIPDSVEGD